MKIGDLVNYTNSTELICACLVLDIDDAHRQRVLKLLVQGGVILEKVWVGHVESLGE